LFLLRAIAEQCDRYERRPTGLLERLHNTGIDLDRVEELRHEATWELMPDSRSGLANGRSECLRELGHFHEGLQFILFDLGEPALSVSIQKTMHSVDQTLCHNRNFTSQARGQRKGDGVCHGDGILRDEITIAKELT
jgi:hypothetical protein